MRKTVQGVRTRRVGKRGSAASGRKNAWLTSRSSTLRRFRNTVENKPEAKEILSAIEDARKLKIDSAKLLALEAKFEKHWKALHRARSELGTLILEGPKLDQAVGNLMAAIDLLEGSPHTTEPLRGLVPKATIRLDGFITIWKLQEQTGSVKAHIKHLQALKANPNPRVKKKETARKKKKTERKRRPTRKKR